MINAAELLIERFCELYTFDRDIDGWSVERFADNEPRKVRLEMVRGLLRYLRIPEGIPDFREGKYFKRAADLPVLLRVMQEEGLTMRWAFPGHEELLRDTWSTWHTALLFRDLLRYRLRLEDVLRFGAGTLYTSVGTLLVPEVFGHVNQRIRKDMVLVNRILAELMNPNHLEFNLQILVRVYGYPDVDLSQIDLDWM